MIRVSSKWVGRVMTFEPISKSKPLYPWAFAKVKRLTAFIDRFDDKGCVWLFISTNQLNPTPVPPVNSGWWQVRLVEIGKPRKISIENEMIFKLQHNVSTGGRRYEKTERNGIE